MLTLCCQKKNKWKNNYQNNLYESTSNKVEQGKT